MCVSTISVFQQSEFPSSHYREEGWPSDQENSAQHPLSRGRGGIPIDGTRNTTPAASIRRLRAIFLVTPPPLLAVMRGGECAFLKMPANLGSCASRGGDLPIPRVRQSIHTFARFVLTRTNILREKPLVGEAPRRVKSEELSSLGRT